MWKTYCGFVVLGAAILVILSAATARADLLFSDNFDNANSAASDYGLNQNLDTREGGDHAQVGWVLGTTKGAGASTLASQIRVNSSDYVANGMYLNNQARSYPTVTINHNFVDAAIIQDGGFIVRFDASPTYTCSQSYLYSTKNMLTPDALQVGVGGGQYSQQIYLSRNVGGSSDRVWWLKPSGSVYVSQRGGTQLTKGYAMYDSSRPTTTTDGFSTPIYTFELRVATSGFTTAHGATAWLYAGSQGTLSNALAQVNLNVTADHLPCTTWTWDTDNTNFISFALYTKAATWFSNSTLTLYSLIDNVSVWSGFRGTPEPSALVLAAMGLLGLLAYAWRRRRRI